MAFDQSTRNRLQKFVSESRSILNEEFTRQLQAIYGMDPKSGSVADLESLSFLDNQGRQTAIILRQTLVHYMASLTIKSEKERTKQGLERIIREQSFTVLNRLGALRMAETRGFLLESVAKGYSSKGFQLFKNLAGSALGETGEAYRQYLFSIFDEFSQDLAVLFDRNSSQGLLFPRESALLSLLDQINHFEIENLWVEDETIGWIYQYFNSQEERKMMRAESQAPRNSRELAVRNQFFTPRYIVEFLTDNTLGRLWYEMTQGKTSLVEKCRYLVRRPNEIFLVKGESATENESDEQKSLSQEDLLKQPVYIPFRELKDPRELRMLDPACGSMHFGLYAFDLFEEIYEEAWQLETELGPDSFCRSKGMESLQATYPSVDEFRKAVPNLVIECNIHGVDIDPRAVQIAGLSLWQRAQRAWHQMGIKPSQRPKIKKSNIVCAEPMPGEREMLREFIGNLTPPVLGQLLETIFDKMELAGEAGTLLKIEEEIASTISNAKDEFNKELLRRKEEQGYFPGFAPRREATLFDFAELTDETSFWDTAEERILESLSAYADQTESEDGIKRLFAEDAAKGFAFIDLCRKRFDVVLMNPPFGEAGKKMLSYISANYSYWNKNILCAFIGRGKLLSESGYVASVIDRSILNKSTYQDFRSSVLLKKRALENVLDLGWGVLDGANVEVSSCILKSDNKTGESFESTFTDLRSVDLEKKQEVLEDLFSKESFPCISHRTDSFLHFPNKSVIYDLPDGLLEIFSKTQTLQEQRRIAYTGHQLQSDRHFLANWEISQRNGLIPNGNYEFLYNGGEYSRYICSPKEVCLFGYFSNLKDKDITNYTFVLRNKEQHGRRGVYFGVRGEYLDAHLVNKNRIFTVEGQAIPCCSYFDSLLLLGYLNSTIASRLINTYCGQHKYSGYINLLPFPLIPESTKNEIALKTEEIIAIKLEIYSWDETSLIFQKPIWINLDSPEKITNYLKEKQERVNALHSDIDEAIINSFNIRDAISLNDIKIYRKNYQDDKSLSKELTNGFPVFDYLRLDVILFAIGYLFGRWDDCTLEEKENSISAKKYFENDLHLHTDNTKGMSIADFNTADSFFTFLKKSQIIDGIFTKLSIDKEYVSKHLSNNVLLFDYQLKKYQVGRRQAPIYWPLQTPSGSYTVWVYYHRLTEQTLYSCVNDFLEGPKGKLPEVTDALNALRNKHVRSNAEEKELTELTDLEAELKDFRDELLHLAKFWKPNLNDGVQITAAPLWKLFQHKQWQRKLKETWDKLERGDYDWAHMAFNIWPERVLLKCHEDRSLAIAHDVENDFWEEVEIPMIRRGKDTGETKVEWQPKKLNEDELKGIITQKIAELR